MTWDSKTVIRKGTVHIELRKMFEGAQMLIIVALDGYNFKGREVIDPRKEVEAEWKRSDSKRERLGINPWPYPRVMPAWVDQYSTKGKQVRMSLNGPAPMTMADFADIQDQVNEAHNKLLAMKKSGEPV